MPENKQYEDLNDYLADDDRMSDLSIRALRCFLAVAEEGSITAAAELLRVSQPSMSRRIKNLEKDLGATLINRSNRKDETSLTDAGRLFYDRARTMVSLMEKAEDELKNADAELSGEITIGCGEMRGMRYLTQAIREFRDDYPKVRFTIFSAAADLIQERMEQGLLDIGLLLEPVDTQRYDHIRTNVVERWVALLPKSWPWPPNNVATVDDLCGLPIMLPSRNSAQNVLKGWFAPKADDVNVVGYCNLTGNAATMVAAELGAFLCIDTGIIHPQVRSLPLSPSLTGESVIAWKRSGEHSMAAARFIDFLQRRNNQNPKEE
ncbi:DNA-binding transcriptional regulator, LysR family [Bifidobacterium bohemicum]|uniref:LysR family transcriptional regulator n=1 Tax=Bifidobacterium bohemicum DSM 22767 TaxID=1437606 RepID=A0A086ZJ79_9BIFI|nr:LysR family transcriptional regulator [Bifidobacterium bohemicum]KFI46579.1 LysR family transcriptional regulator [Bifidobacterium bohemicum DSM 22767]SCB75723.1 DNA-binding transcriptional regulator, LysR family [Bifidobacterium bohemicum]